MCVLPSVVRIVRRAAHQRIHRRAPLFTGLMIDCCSCTSLTGSISLDRLDAGCCNTLSCCFCRISCPAVGDIYHILYYALSFRDMLYIYNRPGMYPFVYFYQTGPPPARPAQRHLFHSLTLTNASFGQLPICPQTQLRRLASSFPLNTGLALTLPSQPSEMGTNAIESQSRGPVSRPIGKPVRLAIVISAMNLPLHQGPSVQ